MPWSPRRLFCLERPHFPVPRTRDTRSRQRHSSEPSQTNTQSKMASARKTDRERAEAEALNEVLANDIARIRGFANDPVALAKYRADVAAGDLAKYGYPISERGQYATFEDALDSPIVPRERCRYCENFPRPEETFPRCSACKLVRYCGRYCQRKRLEIPCERMCVASK